MDVVVVVGVGVEKTGGAGAGRDADADADAGAVSTAEAASCHGVEVVVDVAIVVVVVVVVVMTAAAAVVVVAEPKYPLLAYRHGHPFPKPASYLRTKNASVIQDSLFVLGDRENSPMLISCPLTPGIIAFKPLDPEILPFPAKPGRNQYPSNRSGAIPSFQSWLVSKPRLRPEVAM